MRPLGFAGKSRLEAAQRLLPERVKGWCEQWCFVDVREPWVTQCSEEACAEPGALHAFGWQKAQSAGGTIWLAGSQENAWQRAVFGSFSQDVPSDSTAGYLLGQAQLALINALLDELKQEAVSSLTVESPCTPGGFLSSRILLSISLQDVVLYLLLDAALLMHFLPPLSAKNSLLKRELAIGGAKLKLSISLPLMSLSIDEVNGLSPGDILRVNASLAQPLPLATATAKVVAKGYLARESEQLALQLAATK